MAALKIISPYVGSTLTMDRPVSKHFAEAVYKYYDNIKKINTSSIQPRKTPHRWFKKENYAVSFSGGADSLAVANICPAKTPLILSARKYHSEIGPFETWYNTRANLKTLEAMSNKYQKIAVISDFEFLSNNGSYCVYPDKYAFTIPTILLSDHLKLTGIFVGDILGAFTGNERSKYQTDGFTSNAEYYRSVGLDFDSPVKGVSEIGTEIINRYFGNEDIATTCQYGEYKKPCLKCIKCFRKSFIKAYLTGSPPDEALLVKFNQARPVINLSNKSGIPLPLTLHEITKDLALNQYDILQNIKNKVSVSSSINTKALNKLFFNPYTLKSHSKTMEFCIDRLKEIFPLMTSEEEQIFK